MMTDNLSSPFAVGRTAEIFAWKDGTILKLYRDWCPSNWVDHEAWIAGVVTQAGLPAPRAFEIVEVNGRRGLVYERVEGDSMLQTMRRQPLKLAAYGRMLAELHFQMHCQPGTTLPDQRAHVERSITAAEGLPADLRAAALKKLADLPAGDRLCHGDFHPDNVLLSPQGPVIIDWMTANCGSPWADAARTRLLLTIGQPVHTNLLMRLLLLGRWFCYRGYIRRTLELSPQGREPIQAWLPVMAVARLNETITHERQKLLKIIREGFNPS